MSGSYQGSAGQPEPITAEWVASYHGSATPYQAPEAQRDDYYYRYPPVAQGEQLWAPQPAAGGGGGWGGWPPPPGGGYWPPQPPPQPARRRTGLIAGLVVVLVLFMVAAVGIAIGVGRALGGGDSTNTSGFQNPGTSQNGQGATTAPNAGTPLDSTAIAATIDKAVVDVNTILKYQNGRAAGTGIVIGSSGLVLTNNHVVAGATSISVTEVTDGKTYDASVVGYDRTEDIAVIQLKGASNLPTAPIGDSTKVGVGDAVLAIGNAGGTGGTPTVAEGSVSALNQSITASDESTGTSEQLVNLIEVAANIQSGDSGGPLVDSSAKVIGVNTAASVSGGFHYQGNSGNGTGYAIPINQAMTIAKQITAGQASAKVHIGATGFLGVSVSSGNNTAGAAVSGVVSGSPAESAGLAQGDVITSVNGETVDSPNTLTQLLDGYHPGDRVKVGWIDTSGQSHTATVKLVTGPVG